MWRPARVEDADGQMSDGSLLLLDRPTERRHRPRVREGTVRRERLLRRLAQTTHVPLTLLVAPAGYGKTTLLEHWLQQDPRPVAWLTVDELDDDPDRLVAAIARALDELEPPRSSSWPTRSSCARSRSCSCSTTCTTCARRRRRTWSWRSPTRCRTARRSWLAGRREPDLPIGRLRAQGRLFDLRARDLVMTRREAVTMLSLVGLDLEPEDTLRAARAHRGLAGRALSRRPVGGRPPGRPPRGRALRRRRPAPRGLRARRAARPARRRAARLPRGDVGARRAVRRGLRRGPASPRVRHGAARHVALEPARRPARRRGRVLPLSRAPRRHAPGGAASRATAVRGRAAPAGERLVRAGRRRRSRDRPRDRRRRRGARRRAAVGHGRPRVRRPRRRGSPQARAVHARASSPPIRRSRSRPRPSTSRTASGT